jgi:peptidoglycan/LPS O-acetylase OafA/YrhL
MEGWFHWRTLEILWPTFVGSLLFAVPFSLISYWIVERSLERYQRKHGGRLRPPA